jgi:hypothetical protein
LVTPSPLTSLLLLGVGLERQTVVRVVAVLAVIGLPQEQVGAALLLNHL